MRNTLLALVFTALAAQPAGAEQPAKARALVDKALRAAGGAENLARFPASTWKATGTFYGFGQESAYRGEWAVQPPEQIRALFAGEILGLNLTRIVVVNGNRGWVKMNDAVDELDAEALAEERHRLYANWVASLTPLKNPAFSLELLEDKRIGPSIAAGLKVGRQGQRDVKLYFDKETGLLLQSETLLQDVLSGKEVLQETLYGDYREFKGLQRPTKIVVKWDGIKHAEAQLSEIQLLERLPPETFAKP